MLTVSESSLWLAETIMTTWFVYFQHYCLPQLQPRYFGLYSWGLGLLYATLDLPCHVSLHPFLSVVPTLVLLALEGLVILVKKRWRYLPAFILASLVAYILIEFVDTLSISWVLLFTNASFAVSFSGTVVELILNTIGFGLVLLLTWTTRAPIENVVQSFLGQTASYLILGFGASLGIVLLLLEYTLQIMRQPISYVVFLAGITGVFLTGICMSTYMLIQTTIQRNHSHDQVQAGRLQAQYSVELNRQMAQIREFRHDYQNMLLGLGGYLANHDYDGFRQLYVDIRSRWATSNAAELTIEDLANVSQVGVRYTIYHNYLLAQRLNVNLFVKVPKPLTLTMVDLQQLRQVLERTLPQIFAVVQNEQPAMVTLELSDLAHQVLYRVIFPVPTGAQVRAGYRIVTADNQTWVDFSRATRGLSHQLIEGLHLKAHWGELAVTFTKI